MNDHRLPAEAHIGEVHLRVSNLERSLHFYSELLGFQEIRRPANGGIELSATGKAPSLIVLTELPNAQRKPPHATGLYHVAIRFPNRPALAGVFRNLLNNHWQFQGFADHSVSEALYLADPDDNGIELYVDRVRTKWKWSGDYIAMGSEPLDVENLLAESSSQWSGIDSGTDIGHVHLHVSDLGKAEKFYHGVLGMDVTQRTYPGALFLSAGGYHHHIGVNVWAGRGAPPPPDDAAGLIAFSVEVPDEKAVKNIHARTVEAGISSSDLVNSDGRFSFSFSDEDKNRVVISAPKASESTLRPPH
jgi:catechol 2,3-dioxygenase